MMKPFIIKPLAIQKNALFLFEQEVVFIKTPIKSLPKKLCQPYYRQRSATEVATEERQSCEPDDNSG